MAARTRVSLTDDDSISDHLSLEMVRINAPPLTTTTSAVNPHIDPDEQATLNDSAGTIGPNTYDFLASSNTSVMAGTHPEYELPNIFTFKKVTQLDSREEVAIVSFVLDRRTVRTFTTRKYGTTNQIREKLHVQNSQRIRRRRFDSMDFENSRCRRHR